MAQSLHEALAALGITSAAGTIPGKRTLSRGGRELGQFDAHDGWALVHQLRSAE